MGRLARLMLALSMATCTAGAESAQPECKVLLSSRPQPAPIQTEFDEREPIYAAVTIADVANGPHILTARWHDQEGKAMGETALTVKAKKGRASASLWMRFPERVRLLPSSAREHWQLRVLVDGGLTCSATFYVWR